MGKLIGWLGVAVCLVAVTRLPAAEAQPGGIKVIVNATNAETSLTPQEVSQYFLKRTTRWRGNGPIVPVDLPVASAVRERFSRDVLRRSASAVDSYWTKQIFSGSGLPPLTLRTEHEVIAYVREHPGAIAYVSADTGLGEGVKALEIEPR